MNKKSDWRDVRLDADATIEQAISVLTTTGKQICLVCGDDEKLLGTVTDGDIRRGLIRSLALTEPVSKIMNDAPHVVRDGNDRAAMLKLFSEFRVRAVPVVDAEGAVLDLRLTDGLVKDEGPRENRVVIMAGGLGQRLRPMTDQVPKPLLPVGNKPLLETIIESFVKHNFHHFYISVNYKAELIKRHFGDGADMGVDIQYIEEDERLGTAGGLRLMSGNVGHPLIVMNGDLLTQVDFQALLDYHHEQKATATMCVREYDFQVPFGVVRTENNRITGVDEKPVHRFLVNAGIYVLEPEVLNMIPDQGAHDMTTVFQELIGDGYDCTLFPIREYWLDVGRVDDLNQANWEYDEVFRA